MPSEVLKLQYASPSNSMADEDPLCSGRTGGGGGVAFSEEFILFIGENTLDALDKVKQILLAEIASGFYVQEIIIRIGKRAARIVRAIFIAIKKKTIGCQTCHRSNRLVSYTLDLPYNNDKLITTFDLG